MRKVLISEMVSLDGFFSRPDGNLDWHMVDAEFNEWAINQLNSVDTLIFGRKTYEGMAGWWPTPMALEDDPVVTRKMNETQKVVFSRTLKTADWSHSRLVSADPAQEIERLKAEPGKDMVIFGSGQIVAALSRVGLIDEYRILTCPILLGRGVPMFSDPGRQVNLRLTSSRVFGSGVALNIYEPQT